MKTNVLLSRVILCGAMLWGTMAFASDGKPAEGATGIDVSAAGKTETKPEEILIPVKIPLFSEDFSQFPLVKVNDEKVTLEEFTGALTSLHEGMREGKRAVKPEYGEILHRLINSQLIIQEARNMGLDQQPEVKEALDTYAKKLLREKLLLQHVKDLKADEKEVAKLYRQNTEEWKLKSLEFKTNNDAQQFAKEIKAGKAFGPLYEKAVKDGVAERSKEDAYVKRANIHPQIVNILSGMKAGSVSPVVQLQKGFLVFKVEDVRYVDDAKVKEQVQQEILTKARLKALEDYRDALIKKYVKQKTKLINSLDFEAKKPGFENMLKDKRVIAEIQGEKPITVATLAEAIAGKFYHGVEIAIKEQRVNKSKQELLLDLLSNRVIEKEALSRGIDKTDEYGKKVRDYAKGVIFGTFVEKVIKPEIKLKDEELQAYYKEHLHQYTYPEMYKIDAIVFTTGKDAEAAIDKLKKGMDFKWFKSNAEGRLAEGVRPKLDFLGNTVLKSELPGAVQKALTGVAAGEYRLYAADKEHYVLFVQDVVPSREQPFKEVEGSIMKAVFSNRLNESVESWAKKLWEASDVKIYAEFKK